MKAFSRTRWLVLATAALSTALHAQQPTPAADRESRVTSNAVPAVVPAATPTPVAVTTTTGGTRGTIPMFSSASNIENSTLYYNATGLGIGRFPSQMLDVNGNSVFRGYMQVSRTADATASMGTKSYPIQFNLQVFDSTRGIALNPFFNFQAEPTGNNTASTGATLNLLYFGGVGAPTAAETGLYFNNNGVIHFASGQTFPITQGPAGPQGPVGPAGPKGATGPTGPQGPTGALALPYVASGPGSYLFYLTNTGSTVGGGIYAEGSSGSAQSTFGGVGLTGGGGTGGTANFVNGGIGVLGLGGHAGPGQFASGGTGVRGVGADTSAAQTYGGDGGYFTGGQGTSTGGYGVIAIGADGLNGGKGGDGINAYSGVGGNYAGLFYGNVSVVGNLSKSGGSFKIDDPIDPENKYLSHSFVESPDMKNIYDGNIVTDGSSRAVVELPDYFEALNRDFRYQLTAIGRPAKVWIAAKVTNNRFIIQTDEPGVEVSWQVTGIRQDAWANAHRIPNEEEKTPTEKGHFIHPELFGHGGEISTNEIGHPRNRRPTEKQ